MIRNIGLRSGVIEKQALTEHGRGPHRPVKETHGFRKFFQTALESYLRPSENDLLEGNDMMIGYIGVMDALTISNEFRLTREVQTLRVERINKLEDKILSSNQ